MTDTPSREERMSEEMLGEFERVATALTRLGDVNWPLLVAEARRAREAEALKEEHLRQAIRNVAQLRADLAHEKAKVEEWKRVAADAAERIARAALALAGEKEEK